MAEDQVAMVDGASTLLDALQAEAEQHSKQRKRNGRKCNEASKKAFV